MMVNALIACAVIALAALLFWALFRLLGKWRREGLNVGGGQSPGVRFAYWVLVVVLGLSLPGGYSSIRTTEPGPERFGAATICVLLTVLWLVLLYKLIGGARKR